MRRSGAASTGILLVLLLSACAQATASPVATVSKSPGRAAVPASGAGNWFAPNPINASDLLPLAQPNAPWPQAAAATATFQLSSSSVAALSDADLATLESALKKAGLPVALLLSALTPVSGCGQVPGAPDASTALDLIKRVQASGAQLRFLVMDRPAYLGTHCGLSAMEIAANVGAWASRVRSVAPQAAIGDAELLTEPADGNAYAEWMPAYASVTGSPLAFIHLDLDWSMSDWPSQLSPLQSYARQSGIGLGLVERGNGDDASDALWVANAADRMAAVAASGIPVDSAIFQAAGDREPRLLPESDGTTLTALVSRAAGKKTTLTLYRPTTAPGGGQLVGAKLVDQAGAPIAGAKVELAVRPLNATGEYAQYSASGTVPADVDHVLLGIRVADENADPGPADLALYSASYREGAARERLANPDCAEGLAHWGTTNTALLHIEASDRGPGQMLHLSDNPAQPLQVNSDLFAVTPGAAYTVTFSARVAPVSRGYFTIIFIRGSEVSRTILRFTPALTNLSATTDAAGRLQWQVPANAFPAELDARYPGDRSRWPALASS